MIGYNVHGWRDWQDFNWCLDNALYHHIPGIWTLTEPLWWNVQNTIGYFAKHYWFVLGAKTYNKAYYARLHAYTEALKGLK